jgi:hypothetical protein
LTKVKSASHISVSQREKEEGLDVSAEAAVEEHKKVKWKDAAA